MMRELLCAALMVVGATFMLLAALGLVRLPDVFTRMQAAAKASVLGAGSTLLAMAVYFGDFAVTARCLAVIAFFFITAPIAAHVLGRAAHILGVPLWEGTVVDELRGRYHPETHELSARDTPDPDADPPPAAGRAASSR